MSSARRIMFASASDGEGFDLLLDDGGTELRAIGRLVDRRDAVAVCNGEEMAGYLSWMLSICNEKCHCENTFPPPCCQCRAKRLLEEGGYR